MRTRFINLIVNWSCIGSDVLTRHGSPLHATTKWIWWPTSTIKEDFEIRRELYYYGCVIARINTLHNTLLANVPSLYLLETPENQLFSGVFRVYKMGTVARNRLINWCYAHIKLVLLYCPSSKVFQGTFLKLPEFLLIKKLNYKNYFWNVILVIEL